METGTIHLLVIAGLHLGILAGVMLIVVRRLPILRGWGLAGVALGTVLYVLMVDAQPSVIRATVLVVVMCGAALLGRRPWVQLPGLGRPGGAGLQPRRPVPRRAAVVVLVRGVFDLVGPEVGSLGGEAGPAGSVDLGQPGVLPPNVPAGRANTCGTCCSSA